MVSVFRGKGVYNRGVNQNESIFWGIILVRALGDKKWGWWGCFVLFCMCLIIEGFANKMMFAIVA